MRDLRRQVCDWRWLSTACALACASLVAQPQFVPEVLPGGFTFGWGGDVVVVAAGDVDVDGDCDLVWNEGLPSLAIVVLVNDGLGGFRREANRFPGGAFPGNVGMALDDFDADGALDVITTGNANDIQHWRNDGRGFFRDVSASTLPVNRRDVGHDYRAADFDGDGAVDLLLPRFFWRNAGNGVFTEQRYSGFPTGVFRLRAADVNGDRHPELLFYPINAPGIDIHTNLGGWRFSYLTSVPVFFNLPMPEAFEVADVDGDGDNDLLIVAVLYSRIWLNDGTGHFVDSPASLVPPVTYSAAARFADFDEDGDVDLWMGNGQRFAQPDQLYVNDGRGRFTDQTATRVQQQPMGTVGLAIADVDGDGDIDVIAAHGGSGLSPGILYRNMLRDVAFLGPVRIANTASIRMTARRGFASGPQVVFPALSTLPLTSPIVVPPLGGFRLNPIGLILLAPVTLPAPSGEATLSVPVPAQQSLVGQTVSVQALVAHDAAPSSWRFSNVARAPIQR